VVVAGELFSPPVLPELPAAPPLTVGAAAGCGVAVVWLGV
jgi:hypothetical protein